MIRDSLNYSILKAKIRESEEFTKNVMEGIRKIKDAKVLKIGNGSFHESGDNMVDCIFTVNDKRFSISTFYISSARKIINFTDPDVFKRYFLNLASEISNNNFEKSFLVFNQKVDEDTAFKSLFNSTMIILDKKISQKVILASGSLEDINTTIVNEISPKP